MGFLYETHMHSSEVSGCAVKKAVRQVQTYKQKGYTGIIFTDHFTNGFSNCPSYLSWYDKMKFTVSGYEKAKVEGDKCGLDVFFGWEFTIRGSDFLTYGLDFDFLIAYPDLDRLSLEEYSRIVRSHGGFLAQAHPYKSDYYVEYKFPVDPSFVDAIEVFNSSVSDAANEKALLFALKHDIPMQAGTDSHGRYNEFYSGIELNDRAESIFDIIDAIKARKACLILPL